MRSVLMKAAAFGWLMIGGMLLASPAHAQLGGGEYLQFIENNEELAVQLSGDPAAPISITGPVDDWTIDLTGSGHTLVAGIPITYSWFEPDDGTYNNLTYNGDQTFTLISDAATPTGVFVLNNGDADFIGVDSAPGGPDNNFLVLEQVIDNVPEPASLAVLSAGLIGLGWARRRARGQGTA